jgi:hypothetical protein
MAGNTFSSTTSFVDTAAADSPWLSLPSSKDLGCQTFLYACHSLHTSAALLNVYPPQIAIKIILSR